MLKKCYQNQCNEYTITGKRCKRLGTNIVWLRSSKKVYFCTQHYNEFMNCD